VEASRNQTGCLKTALILVGVSVVFIALIILIADIKCAYDVADWWMPLYPNGETVDVQYDLFRPRAWGRTTLTMTTTDDVETVKQFYRDTRIATLKNKTKGIATGDSHVQPLENGAGSRIILVSVCGI
jgi:hypothetical protein